MSRAVPLCRSFVAADIAAGTNGNRDSAGILCIGSRCSDYLPASDNTPAANLMVCGRNPTAPPWVDPAAEESK